MNNRGGASIAAFGLALLLTAATLQMADAVRSAERRSTEAEREAAARGRILARAVAESKTLDGGAADEKRAYEENLGGSTLEVAVVWRRRGGRWVPVSWTEIRRWPSR